jgi:hypothetical protein
MSAGAATMPISSPGKGHHACGGCVIADHPVTIVAGFVSVGGHNLASANLATSTDGFGACRKLLPSLKTGPGCRQRTLSGDLAIPDQNVAISSPSDRRVACLGQT